MQALSPQELPGSLADPLQIPGPEASNWTSWWIALAVVLALALLYYPWRKRQERETLPRHRSSTSPEPRQTVGQRIRDLRRRALATSALRPGCHQLSELLRSHYDHQSLGHLGRLPVSHLTALELEDRLGEHAVSRLFLDLARLQFSPPEPERKEFRRICGRAIHLVEGAGRSRKSVAETVDRNAGRKPEATDEDTEGAAA